MSKKYTSVVHVRWELPFPLMLPSNGFLCWEPGEGVAAFNPEGHIGKIQWKRTCEFISPEIIFHEIYQIQDQRSMPTHSYKMTSKLRTGEEILTAELYGGPEGGFAEARAYTVANIFLCIAHPESYKDKSIVERANAAMNNVIELYRFFTLDPLQRPIRSHVDHYCTTLSEASVPQKFQQLPPDELLENINQLYFGSEVGKNRCYLLGLCSCEDLETYSLLPENIQDLYNFVREEHKLELFHKLIFSSIRWLKRKEGALATIDAQSAFEASVASMLRDGLISEGWNRSKIDRELVYKGSLHLLQSRLKKLDEIARTDAKRNSRSFTPFLGSKIETDWRQNLYNIRNEIVHKGKRELSFDIAKEAIVSGLKAISYLNCMCPIFSRQFMWKGQATELQHINESAGRLFRLFET